MHMALVMILFNTKKKKKKKETETNTMNFVCFFFALNCSHTNSFLLYLSVGSPRKIENKRGPHIHVMPLARPTRN